MNLVQIFLALAISTIALVSAEQRDCSSKHGEFSHGQTGYLNDAQTVYYRCTDSTLSCFQVEPFTADEEGEPVDCADAFGRKLNNFNPFGVFLQSSLWTYGITCIDTLPDTFSAVEKDVFKRAMIEIEKVSNVRFMSKSMCENTNARDYFCGGCRNYISVSYPGALSTTCSSNVGMLGNQQAMTLSDRCFKAANSRSKDTGIVVHEMLHSLGVMHEHQHPDRKVVLLHDRMTVPPSNYEIIRDLGLSTYDLGSIMHYGGSFCEQLPSCPTTQVIIGSDGKPTCIPQGTVFCDARETAADGCTMGDEFLHCLPAEQATFIGQRSELSEGDKIVLETMYPKQFELWAPGSSWMTGIAE